MATFFTIILVLAISFLTAFLARKFASHTLINGFMSKEMADEVFPWWRKKEGTSKKE